MGLTDRELRSMGLRIIRAFASVTTTVALAAAAAITAFAVTAVVLAGSPATAGAQTTAQTG